MKKLSSTVIALLIACLAFAQEREPFRVIEAPELPDASQSFITRHFGGLSAVDYVGVWLDYYGVNTQDGQRLNFYMDGSLLQALAHDRLLPKSILSDFPPNVSSYVNDNYQIWELAEVIIREARIAIRLVDLNDTANLVFSLSGELLADSRVE